MNPLFSRWICGLSAIIFLNPLYALEQTQTSPDCQLNAFSAADKLNLKQFQGKVVYIDFWASWCIPCAKSFPFLNTLNRDYKNRGLEIIGVNLDENPEDAQAFLDKYPSEFNIVSDNGNQQCAQDFGVKAMPSSYIIDRKGLVRHIHLGFKPGETDEIIATVEALLSEP